MFKDLKKKVKSVLKIDPGKTNGLISHTRRPRWSLGNVLASRSKVGGFKSG